MRVATDPAMKAASPYDLALTHLDYSESNEASLLK